MPILEKPQFGSFLGLMLALLSALIASMPAEAQSETVLYNFCSRRGTCPDGAYPLSRLTADAAGNLYGTTHSGSPYGDVFEVSSNGSGSRNETVLYAFTGGTDGAYPQFSPVTFDNLGNLYGTTQDGGAFGYGVVFELHPTGSGWTETVLHSFAGTGDGSGPDTGVIIDAAGNLYGAAPRGGPGNVGIVFELSPSGEDWTEQVIYTFDISLYFAPSGLTMDTRGNIFGAANLTVFELSPNGSGGWMPTVLHTFPGKYLGVVGTPALDNAGNMYGTLLLEKENGTMGVGEVYKMTQRNGQWKMQTLQRWEDGTGPYAGVVLDASGNIFGTTIGGGSNGQGTVFELVAVNNKPYKQEVLWNFNGADGGQPASSLILDSAGNLYGTAEFGGSIGFGTVFEVTP